MITPSPLRSFTISIVPTCGDQEVLVKLEALALNRVEWECIASGSSMASYYSEHNFVGRVEVVGDQAQGQGIVVGDFVAGHKRVGSIDTFQGSSPVHCAFLPEEIWIISSDKIQALGLMLGSSHGCTII